MMFRSVLKKITAFSLAAMMAVSMIGMSTVSADAASNPTKIYLNKKFVSVKVGKTYTLKVTKAKPNSKKYRTVKWSTSDKTIATVSSKGKVKGIKPGKVTITATSTKNKKVKATCTVTVYKNAYITKKPSTSGNMAVYKMPRSSSAYRFIANGKSYKITDAVIKNFTTLFGTSKNSLISKWNAKKSIKISLGDLSATVTGTKTDRTLKITGPEAYAGTYVARLYKNKEGHDYMFAVKGDKTNNKWQKFYVDGNKTYYTYTATNKQGVKYTFKVRKDGKSMYLKAGKTYLYKYYRKSKYDEFHIDLTRVKFYNIKGYYWGKVTK